MYMNFPNFYVSEIFEYFTFKKVLGQSAQCPQGRGLKALVEHG
jgi:hypothetical protein